MADPLLTLAGRKRAGGAYTGGAVVQLDADGAWSELHSGGAVAWNLNEFTFSDGSVILFYIQADGFVVNDRPRPGTLYRSIDLGAAWTDVTPSSGSPEFASDIAQDAAGNLWLLTDERKSSGDEVATFKPSRIYVSTDKGATWTLKDTSTNSGLDRYYFYRNITCHPTNSSKILVEATEQVGLASRIVRSTDGGDTWSLFTPTAPSPPIQLRNTGGAQQSVFNYTSAGAVIWEGSLETAQDDFFVLRSVDDGTTWTLQHTEVAAAEAGTGFVEVSGVVYAVSTEFLFSVTPAVGSVTKIAADTSSPFSTAHVMHGISRHDVSGASTLLLGCGAAAPFPSASIFTRPADLSSDWAAHSQASTMDADLGYVLWVERLGVIGATPPPTPEDLRPPQDQGPPVAPSGGDPGAAFPPTGIGRKRRERLTRRRRRETRQQQTMGSQRRQQALGDQVDKAAPPRGTAPVEPRKWLTFGWTTPAVVNSQKTLTLRPLSPVEAVQWRMGELIYAYDSPPSEGGARVALLRLTHDPYEVSTATLRGSDFNALGFGYLQATGAAAPSGSTPLEVWQRLQVAPERLYVVRFRVERLYDQRAPTRGTIKV